MEAAIQDSDLPVRFVPKFREYGIDILDGGTSYQSINFCPWCGAKLPHSLRKEWFDHLENIGIDPADGVIPDKYRDHAWYSSKVK